MATHSSVLAWGIPGTGEPGGLPSMGSHRVLPFSMFSFFAECILLSNIHQISPLDCQLPGGRVTVSVAHPSTISTRRSAGSWQVLLTGTTVFHTEALFTSVRSNEEIMLLEQDARNSIS